MKKTIISTLITLLVFSFGLTSCKNEEPDSPDKFDIYGMWYVQKGIDTQGNAYFNYGNGSKDGYCLFTDEAGNEVKVPFEYDARISKVQPGGMLIINMIADPADYPDIPSDCISFSPGEYWLSPTDADNCSILKDSQLIWSIEKAQ